MTEHAHRVSGRPRPAPLSDAPAGEAIPQLVERYGGQLNALATRFCGDRTQAEDCLQEVFLQAFRKWDTFQGRADPKTWLYTIASRVCQRMHRKRAGEPDQVGSLEELLPFGDPLIAMIPADQPEELQQLIQQEAHERIDAAIAALPQEFRLPLILKELVGFSVPETARILGLEEGTVKSRVHRARLRLRAEVDKALPRQDREVGPPPYERQMCLDLLHAKQEALDHGEPFDKEIICDRCRSVFASLDLTQAVCEALGRGELPPDLQRRVHRALAVAGASASRG